MNAHRFREQLEIEVRLPRPAAPAVAPGSFFYYPTATLAWSVEQSQAQQALYRTAYENAVAVARPSLPERRLLDYWN